jgi:hypothetical protein
MEATLLSAAICKCIQIHFFLWKTRKWHAMGLIWNANGLCKFVKDMGKLEKLTLTTQQEHAIQLFRLSWRYCDPKVNGYLQLRLMPWLMACSFQYYMRLLNAIQLPAFGHSSLWEQEPTLTMLCYNSVKLLTI